MKLKQLKSTNYSIIKIEEPFKIEDIKITYDTLDKLVINDISQIRNYVSSPIWYSITDISQIKDYLQNVVGRLFDGEFNKEFINKNYVSSGRNGVTKLKRYNEAIKEVQEDLINFIENELLNELNLKLENWVSQHNELTESNIIENYSDLNNYNFNNEEDIKALNVELKQLDEVRNLLKDKINNKKKQIVTNYITSLKSEIFTFDLKKTIIGNLKISSKFPF